MKTQNVVFFSTELRVENNLKKNCELKTHNDLFIFNSVLKKRRKKKHSENSEKKKFSEISHSLTSSYKEGGCCLYEWLIK